MKILILTNDITDCFVSRIPLAKYLKRLGNDEVHIYTHIGAKAVPEYCLDLACRRGVFSYIKAFRKIRFDNYDVVMLRGIEMIVASAFICSRKGPRYIYLLSGLGKAFMIKGFPGVIVRKIYIGILECIELLNGGQFIVQNDTDRNDLMPLDTIIIRGSGVVPSLEHSMPKLIKDKLEILVALRFIPSKGYKDVLQAAERIKFCDNIHITIAGDYNNLKNDEIKLIKSLNNNVNINFTGFVEDLTTHFRRCHVAWLPTRYREGVPRFLIESLSYGLVICTTRAPGCAELFSNNNGFEYAGTEEFVSEMLNLFKFKSKYGVMSKRSVDLFNSNYSSEIIFKKYEKVLKS